MIYLDWAATAPIKYPTSEYAIWMNANTSYAIQSKKSLSNAEEMVKKVLGVKSGRVLFGGCASEIVDKIFNKDEDTWWVCSPYEHDCIYSICDGKANTVEGIRLASGWEDFPTIFCHQLANNVTGAIFDLKPYGDWAKESDHHIFLCDLTASIGKVKLPDFEDLGVDVCLWSGHKLGTEKNLGCAWFSDKAIKWLGEDFKLQLGTPNVEGAMAVAEATWDAVRFVDHYNIVWNDLIRELLHRLEENGVKVEWIGGESEDYVPAINAIYLPNINADALQQYLASKQIYVGLGASACAGNHDYRQIEAFGISKEEAEHIIRISFGDTTSVKDIQELVEEIKSFKEKFV